MATQPATMTRPEQDSTVEAKLQKLQELYADAPELAKTALKNVIPAFKQELAAVTTGAQNAGRIGARQGSVSELTGIFPFAEGGAKRLRGLLELLGGHFQGADVVGTVHDMRFVFLDNDTKLLFATAYDGEWDAYIDDFATKIPDAMDVLFSNAMGWPGIRSPKVKDWIVAHQLPAESWYVANPNLTVTETRRLQRVGKAVEEFLDKIG
jgi:hypothetical protein